MAFQYPSNYVGDGPHVSLEDIGRELCRSISNERRDSEVIYVVLHSLIDLVSLPVSLGAKTSNLVHWP